MGAVGKDNYSDILESKASEFGLVVKYQHHDTEPTGENYSRGYFIINFISFLLKAKHYLLEAYSRNFDVPT